MYKGKWHSFCFPPDSDNNVVIDLPSEGLHFERYSLSNALFFYWKGFPFVYSLNDH